MFCHLLYKYIHIRKGCSLRQTLTCHMRINFIQRCYYWLEYIWVSLPLGANCDSHRCNKIKYSIPQPNTWITHQHIDEYLNFAECGVAHATFVKEINYNVFKWCIARLPPNFANRCWAMHANIYRVVKQCQSWNLRTWHSNSNVQGVQKGVHSNQQCGVWVLVLPLRHQALCEWQQKEVCSGLAYSTQHMHGLWR